MMPASTYLIAFAAIATLATAAAAQSQTTDPARTWMKPDALKSAFSGVTIEGVYADGRPFEESYFASGRLKYIEDARNLIQRGRWSIVSGTFCTLYDIRPTGGCFRVRRHSDNCFEFYFQSRNEAMARSPRPGRPSWTARAWRKGETSTCHEKPIV